MEVEIAAEAERDLADIVSYIAQDSSAAAARMADELRAACEGLSSFAERFPLVPRYASLGIRRRVVGNYLIFYRVEASRVVIIHVLHGARDYSDLLE